VLTPPAGTAAAAAAACARRHNGITPGHGTASAVVPGHTLASGAAACCHCCRWLVLLLLHAHASLSHAALQELVSRCMLSACAAAVPCRLVARSAHKAN
jgi:hypothetical protein